MKERKIPAQKEDNSQPRYQPQKEAQCEPQSKIPREHTALNTQRTPLILIILKFPFLLTKFLVSYFGCLTYAPFYIYLRIFQVKYYHSMTNIIKSYY